MRYLSKALLELAPGEEWIIMNGEITWLTSGSHPTQEQIDAKVTELSTSEPLRRLRLRRNEILAQSDWRVVKAMETGIAMSDDWKTYRQTLRDITQHYQSLDTVVWPTEPS
jgi:hypothetical protein